MRFPHLSTEPKPHTTTAATDAPPLRLHTYHLTSTQQSHLAQNPTYSAQLAALSDLATQVQLLKDSLRQREVGKLPDSKSTELSRRERDALERPREECKALEEKLWRWDDELAGLAEGLLARPRFGVGQEVVWKDGGWWWRVPGGSMTLPRHRQSAEVPVERYGLSSFPSPKLTRRITKLFRRSPSPRSRLQRRQSTASRFVE